MSKIKKVADAIKKGLSFDDYAVSTEVNKNIKTVAHKEDEKVKSTFYIPRSAQDDFETIFHTLSLKRKKVSRSDLMNMAIGLLKEHFKEDLNG